MYQLKTDLKNGTMRNKSLSEQKTFTGLLNIIKIYIEDDPGKAIINVISDHGSLAN
jgi:hypothetical protein